MRITISPPTKALHLNHTKDAGLGNHRGRRKGCLINSRLFRPNRKPHAVPTSPAPQNSFVWSHGKSYGIVDAFGGESSSDGQHLGHLGRSTYQEQSNDVTERLSEFP